MSNIRLWILGLWICRILDFAKYEDLGFYRIMDFRICRILDVVKYRTTAAMFRGLPEDPMGRAERGSRAGARWAPRILARDKDRDRD